MSYGRHDHSVIENTQFGEQGTDKYNGGGGADWVLFDTTNRHDGGGSVNIDLSLGSGQVINDGFGNTETFKSIENIVGSDFNDVIIGNGKKNEILASGGDDTVTGGGNADKFIFGNYQGNGFGDHITDFGDGADKLLFDRAYIDGLDATLSFRMGTKAKSQAGDSQFFFHANDHTLYLDINGKASGGVMMVAVLEGVTTLSKSDLVIVENYIDIV